MKDFDEWRLALEQPWGPAGLWLGVAVAMLVVALGVYSTRRERISRRALLSVLRTGSALCALVLFLQPAIQLENVTRLPNHVAVLVDRSASMGLSETPGIPTRAARAAHFIDDARPAFAGYRAQHLVDFYTFGQIGSGGSGSSKSEIEPATEATLSSPDSFSALRAGDSTHLREALQAIRARYEGKDLGGVVLVSDGVDNGRFAEEMSGKELSASGKDFLRALDAPVYTVGTGAPGLCDIAVTRVLADDFAFARNVVKVEAVVRVLGARAFHLGGEKLSVQLKRDGAVVRTVEVPVSADGEQKVSFEITPDRVGKYLYEVSTPILDGDAIPENNSRAFLLKVIRDKIRVLLVAGRPSWDERFLRGLLKHDPNVDLISFFILRTPNDVEAVSPDEMSLIPFPTEELFQEQLRSFDLVFLQNFNYGPYGIGAYLTEIKNYVLEGGGLAMIGGDLSFTQGGWADSPVAEVLPVELYDKSVPEAELRNVEPFKLRLTAEGRGHPITALKLDPRENAAHWAAMPLLDGANLVAGVKPGATVLGVHPTLTSRDGKPLPVLTIGEAGKGRALTLLSDSSWRWGFGAAGLGRDGEDARGQGYQTFWENAMRWLVRDPELRLLRVEADRGEYHLGEKPKVTVRALDAEYHPARKQEIALSLTRADARLATDTAPLFSKTVITDDEGIAQLDIDAPSPLPAGGYRIVGRARRPITRTAENATFSSEPTGAAMQAAEKDEDLFLVRGASRELESPEADDTILRAIADASAARYLGVLPAPAALRDLEFKKPEVVRINQRRDLELWSTWYTLVAAASLLAAEWILRRRTGLA